MAGWVPETRRFESFYSPDIGDGKCLYVINPSKEPEPRRCRNFFDDSEFDLAKSQRQKILKAQQITISLVVAYIKSLCCTRADHNQRIEDSGCMRKLAEDWRREINAERRKKKPTQQRYPSRSQSNDIEPPDEPIHQVPEFRPYKANPDPSECVARKILKPIATNDHEKSSGSYGSDLRHRVDDWAKCGYTPEVVFSIGSVLHPRRVEFLTHHELIKEWRKECWCKACKGLHLEWFEVTDEKAKEVATLWTKFVTDAKPYDGSGCFKPEWKRAVKRLGDDGEAITAKKLLEVHDQQVAESQGIKTEESCTAAEGAYSAIAVGTDSPDQKSLPEKSSCLQPGPRRIIKGRTASLKLPTAAVPPCPSSQTIAQSPTVDQPRPFSAAVTSSTGTHGFPQKRESRLTKDSPPFEQLNVSKAILPSLGVTGHTSSSQSAPELELKVKNRNERGNQRHDRVDQIHTTRSRHLVRCGGWRISNVSSEH
ncbi:hypothetical protein BX600DRAFT_503446 [Xylariales sp. PMI_506]|nr:hypothetical protein BX600DRAFT_503446 [Xylariales sp. PMI_506]